MISTNLQIPQSPLLLTLLNTCLHVEVKLSLLHLFWIRSSRKSCVVKCLLQRCKENCGSLCKVAVHFSQSKTVAFQRVPQFSWCLEVTGKHMDMWQPRPLKIYLTSWNHSRTERPVPNNQKNMQVIEGKTCIRKIVIIQLSPGLSFKIVVLNWEWFYH